MIKLFCFGPNLGLADPSPFVMKVAAYMKMAEIQFETVPGVNNLRRAPKGKLPYIDDNGEIIADSFFILKYLEKTYDTQLDEHLKGEEKALANLLIRSLDENFYWCIVNFRWLQDDTWPHIKNTFFGSLPFPLKHIVPLLARRGVESALKKQGLGRHSDDEIMAIAEETLESLSIILGDKKYFFGEKPCSLDAAAYGFLAQVTLSTLDGRLNRTAAKYSNLVRFCERIRREYFPEYTV